MGAVFPAPIQRDSVLNYNLNAKNMSSEISTCGH
jgi:hypothetical protein